MIKNHWKDKLWNILFLDERNMVKVSLLGDYIRLTRLKIYTSNILSW